MTSGLKSRSNSLSKINEEVDKLFSLEKKNSEEDPISLIKNFFEEDKDNNEIPIDIDKKVLEIAEKRELELANSKKCKTKKIELDILNEQLEDLFKKNISESKTETKGTDSLSKKSKKRKTLIKGRKNSDEDYNISLDDNKSISSFMNTNSNFNENYSYIGEESCSRDDKELIEFMNRKTCRKKNLQKYQKKYYEKRKMNIINLNEDDDDNEECEEVEENRNEDEIELKNDKDKKKHLKRLIKNTDNKEMKLPLDTECIICCSIIKELANPDGCNHDFCKVCLIEWSQRSNKCPICKTKYNSIFIYDKGIKKQLSLTEIKYNHTTEILDNNDNNNEGDNNENNDDDSDDEGCYICGKNTDQANLLVCDRCQEIYCHYYCNNLEKIPEGKWYCTYCLQKMKLIKQTKKKIEHFFL